jgi:hypothetical protein
MAGEQGSIRSGGADRGIRRGSETTRAVVPPDERRALHREVIAALEGYRREGAIRLPSEAVLVAAVR